jgi:hypothetical protein
MRFTFFALVAVGGAAWLSGGCGSDVTVFGAGAGGANGTQSASTQSGSTQSGSTGTSGQCQCGAAAFPVCGEDGNTYDAACGFDCVPVDVACEQPCPCPTCEELAALYRAAVDEARGCDASIDMPQCTLSVPDSIVCGCATFVNPAHQDAVARLQTLTEQADRMGCFSLIDCAPCVPPPDRGKCEAGRVDACVDVYN